MTCRELSQVLLEYTSGEISTDERAEFDEHIRGCENCREYLREYRRTMAVCHAAFAAGDADAADDMSEETIRQIVGELG